MPKPTELIFALKAFASAMIAFAIALWLGLDNPYWAMATVYIVAQPFTGTVRSKALYRFCGTILGGAAAVAMVPNLVNAPVLLTLALACWVAVCLYLSLMQRSARSYTFMLASYTAGIIVFPSIAMPDEVFHIALARVEEISLGIGCMSVVGSVLFPLPLGPVLAARIRAWTKPAADWLAAALSGQQEERAAKAARARLAAEAVDIDMTMTQLAFDVSPLAIATRQVVRLRLYVLSLMPIIASIGDRVSQLQRLNAVTPALQKLLDKMGEWIGDGSAVSAETPDMLLGEIAAQEQENERDLAWESILRTALLARLAEVVSMVRHARLIRHYAIDGAGISLPPRRQEQEPALLASPVQVRDHGMAALSAFAAAGMLVLLLVFWIMTAWPFGSGAALMASIACSFFANEDDPAPAIAQMLRNAVIALTCDAIYLFMILPRVETFTELVLVLLPAAMVIGVLAARPETFGTGMILGAFGSTNLALGNGYKANFVDYVNNSLAMVIGLATALVMIRVIRSVGAAWSARRLLRAGWRDIATAATTDGAFDRTYLAGLMLDRLGLLMPRLATVSESADLAAADALADLRVGLNAIRLRHEMKFLKEPERGRITAVLEAIARHYRGDPLHAPDDSLLRQIDQEIMMAGTLLSAIHDRHHRAVLMALVGLRGVLFRDAPAPVSNLAMAA